MKIVIAGASGFVGQSLLEDLSQDYEVIALQRNPVAASASAAHVERRQCDLFSLLQAEEALKGADIALYLVHSMLPTARLSQGDFEDSDLLLADNFARAAEKCGVSRILYLGGLIPNTPKLSRHLRSRLEVEHALSSRKIPLTTLRSGLILGQNGSSFQILYILVKRLPVMLCPKWVSTLTQAIALSDVIALVRFCISEPQTSGQTYDIGGPDVVTYRELMKEVAQELGVRRFFLDVPFFTPGLSRLWVRLITGASPNLVTPLIESLRHEMIVRNRKLLELYGKPLMHLRTAISNCLLETKKQSLRVTTQLRSKSASAKKDVRSIQRLVLPSGKDATWVAHEYFRWLPGFLHPFVQVIQIRQDSWSFQIRGFRFSLLVLSYSQERSTPERQVFYISGGLLVRVQSPKPRGRLEFRQVIRDEYVIAAIHDFTPRLPWVIYRYTQAIVHLWVMRNFGSYLQSYSVGLGKA